MSFKITLLDAYLEQEFNCFLRTGHCTQLLINIIQLQYLLTLDLDPLEVSMAEEIFLEEVYVLLKKYNWTGLDSSLLFGIVNSNYKQNRGTLVVRLGMQPMQVSHRNCTWTSDRQNQCHGRGLIGGSIFSLIKSLDEHIPLLEPYAIFRLYLDIISFTANFIFVFGVFWWLWLCFVQVHSPL